MVRRAGKKAAPIAPEPADVLEALALVAGSSEPRPTSPSPSTPITEAQYQHAAGVVDGLLARVQLAPPVTVEDCTQLRLAIRAELPDTTVEVYTRAADKAPLRSRLHPDTRPAELVITVWVGEVHRDRKIERVVAL